MKVMGRGGSGGHSLGFAGEAAIAIAVSEDDWSWFSQAAEELRCLEVGRPRSWRAEASELLFALDERWREGAVDQPQARAPVVTLSFARSELELIVHTAFELQAEELPEALADDALTWRSLAADDLGTFARRALAQST